MGYGSWFNVRLMNCEIFIFTYSLSFWDPVSFFLMMGEVGGGGGGGRACVPKAIHGPRRS